jgi:glycosyltransferase involved in cell wall biosynthesis
VFYVSYDGVEEPLGRSQVLAYLTRLAPSYDITLISFEKSRNPSATLRAELERANIAWFPLRYHDRPPVLSTALDVMAGRRALIRAARVGAPAIVHVRSDVPAMMALSVRRATNGHLLFDIRGFWADERVEGGLWRADGILYRIAKRCERRFFAEADAIVTLTEASVPQVRGWAGSRSVPIEVIPTCVDLQRFLQRPERPDGPHAVWSGSLGTWYRFDLTARIASALALPLTVVTRQTALARQVLAGYPASVRSVAPEAVPAELFSGDIGLCLIASSFSKVASAPTRFAEYLAAGMPVLVTPGVGDLESIVEDHVVGVVLRGEDHRSIANAAERILPLAADRAVRERCRSVARQLFDVEAGSAHDATLYRQLLGR